MTSAHFLKPLLLAALATLTTGVIQAQTVAANVALPFYTPGHFMQGAYRQWYAPRTVDFASQAQALPPRITAACEATPANAKAALQAARTQWALTAAAWDRLSGVQIGPLLQRRSARQIDFMPTRPELIQRAILTAPGDAAAMERIGTPAKGLPALEWLLWTHPITASPAADCRYAVQVAHDIHRESQGLAADFAALALKDWSDDEDASVPAMSELVNQWVGGLEHLRWTEMEKPMRTRLTQTVASRKVGGQYPRSASGQTVPSWNAHWSALQALAVAPDAHVPAAGLHLVPLESYLRGRGLNPLANQLTQTVVQASRQFASQQPRDQASLARSVQTLTQLKQLAQGEMAQALQVSIGFSDADGD